jgi:hypothetical protein
MKGQNTSLPLFVLVIPRGNHRLHRVLPFFFFPLGTKDLHRANRTEKEHEKGSSFLTRKTSRKKTYILSLRWPKNGRKRYDRE